MADRNPLSGDPVLFDLYMRALTELLSTDEIRSALSELNMSANRMRHALISDARRVLALASREFAVYEDALKSASAEPEFSPLVGVRVAGRVLLVSGLVLLIGGLVTNLIWIWGWVLFWAAGTTLAAAGCTFVLTWLCTLPDSWRVLPVELVNEVDMSVNEARIALIVELVRRELLPEARTRINVMRADRFDSTFSVTSSPGLHDTNDSVFDVPTRTADEVEALIANVTGISLGISGPRGSGKSTILRHYCNVVAARPRPVSGWDRALRAWNAMSTHQAPIPPPWPDVRCVVSAPVDYAPRDFVLHLFAEFCKHVIAAFTPPAGRQRHGNRRPPWQAMTQVVGTAMSAAITWLLVISGLMIVTVNAWTLAAAAVICAFSLVRWTRRLLWWRAQSRSPRTDSLTQAARRNLARVRHLQSRSATWSGTIRLPVGLDGQYTTALNRSEQPLTHPEVVAEFRGFARRVAAMVHEGGGRVFVGVDELDKIGSAEHAERFLNELKGVFGVPHVHFLVSVSDDALDAFERRGIPLRDAFDSSFDEIVRVGRLTYAESRRLLFRRVIGLSEPYVGLCHVLSGGLARDLIRVARQVVQVGTALGTPAVPTAEAPLLKPDVGLGPPVSAGLDDVVRVVVAQEISRKALSFQHALTNLGTDSGLPLLQILHDASNGAAALNDLLAALCCGDAEESAAQTRLRVDYAAYAYFCQTVGDVFGTPVGDPRLKRCTGPPAWAGDFDALAAARAAFATDARIAWQAINDVRRSWGLVVRDLAHVQGDTGASP